MRCGGSITDLFPVLTGVCQGCVLAPTLFSTCIDWILGRMSERSSCTASFGNVRISDLDFADDAVIFVETLDTLLGALEVLNEESEPLGLRVSEVKNKIQAFNDILDAARRFVVCIVRERQLRLHGHVAQFPDADPAQQILSTKEPHEWRRPMGRPHASWLQQVDWHLKEMRMGQSSTWGMARWKPKEYRWKVVAATRCSGTCTHT